MDAFPVRIDVNDARKMHDGFAAGQRFHHRVEVTHVGIDVGTAEIDANDVVVAREILAQT